MDINKIRPYLLYQFKTEHDLFDAIEELSLNFTQERPRISDYLKDARLISAYTLFYLTTNVPKFKTVLKWMPENFLDEIKECDLVDVGAGPGTFSLAFWDWGGKGDVYQLETSEMMQKQAKILAQGLFSNKHLYQLRVWNNSTNRPKLALFGHSANEMGGAQVLKYLDEIDPDHILFIEPGTKSFFPEMLKIRESLLKRGHNILFPCPTHDSCPMVNSENDWCHQFIRVTHSSDVERISQIMRKDRKLLPLTFHVYSKSLKNSSVKERIVRVHPPTKFSFEWDVCKGSKLDHYQIMKRPYNKKAIKELENVLSGASIETECEKVMEASKRVKLLHLK